MERVLKKVLKGIKLTFKIPAYILLHILSVIVSLADLICFCKLKTSADSKYYLTQCSGSGVSSPSHSSNTLH